MVCNHHLVTIDSEKMAKRAHELYEKFAQQNNWNTQKSTQVKWEDLPQENKNTMIETFNALIDEWNLRMLQYF